MERGVPGDASGPKCAPWPTAWPCGRKMHSGFDAGYQGIRVGKEPFESLRSRRHCLINNRCKVNLIVLRSGWSRADLAGQTSG